MRDNATKWLQDNATMYRGNNASDCMIAAFCAGASSAIIMREALQKIVEISDQSECECGVPCDCSSGAIFYAGRVAREALYA